MHSLRTAGEIYGVNESQIFTSMENSYNSVSYCNDSQVHTVPFVADETMVYTTYVT